MWRWRKERRSEATVRQALVRVADKAPAVLAVSFWESALRYATTTPPPPPGRRSNSTVDTQCLSNPAINKCRDIWTGLKTAYGNSQGCRCPALCVWSPTEGLLPRCHEDRTSSLEQSTNLLLTSPAQLFLVSGPFGSHGHIFPQFLDYCVVLKMGLVSQSCTESQYELSSTHRASR
jgi:hypothetical protein